jgi:hypothetical protein
MYRIESAAHVIAIKTDDLCVLGHAAQIITHNVALLVGGEGTTQILYHCGVESEVSLGECDRRLGRRLTPVGENQYNLQHNTDDQYRNNGKKRAAPLHVYLLLYRCICPEKGIKSAHSRMIQENDAPNPAALTGAAASRIVLMP